MATEYKIEHPEFRLEYAGEPDVPFTRDPEAGAVKIATANSYGFGFVRVSAMPAVEDPDSETIETAKITHHTYALDYLAFKPGDQDPAKLRDMGGLVFQDFAEFESFVDAAVRVAEAVREKYPAMLDAGRNPETV